METGRTGIFMIVTLILAGAFSLSSGNGQEDTLLGPIAHIDVDLKRMDESYHFAMSGVRSYMHTGRIVEYHWHLVRNDTVEFDLFGPFQTLFIDYVCSYNITLTVTSSDTRFNTKRMSLDVKDDGFGSFNLRMSIEKDDRLMELFEASNRKPPDDDIPLGYYIAIGGLGTSCLVELLIIIVLVRKRTRSG